MTQSEERIEMQNLAVVKRNNREIIKSKLSFGKISKDAYIIYKQYFCVGFLTSDNLFWPPPYAVMREMLFFQQNLQEMLKFRQ